MSGPADLHDQVLDVMLDHLNRHLADGRQIDLSGKPDKRRRRATAAEMEVSLPQ